MINKSSLALFVLLAGTPFCVLAADPAESKLKAVTPGPKKEGTP